jgi:hypothetical protein
MNSCAEGVLPGCMRLRTEGTSPLQGRVSVQHMQMLVRVPLMWKYMIMFASMSRPSCVCRNRLWLPSCMWCYEAWCDVLRDAHPPVVRATVQLGGKRAASW